MKASKSDSVFLKPGKYWIGDPCYVLGDENGFSHWHDILEQTDYFNGEGIFEIPNNSGKSGLCAVFSTAYGDGLYLDDEGREYPVDAGLISAIPVEIIQVLPRADMGNIVDIPREFQPEYSHGDIRFGPVIIHTDPSDPEEYGYDDYEHDDISEFDTDWDD